MRFGLASILLASSLLGCSSRAPSTESSSAAPLVEECRTYLATYGECMRSLSPDRPEIAAARVDVARSALAQVQDTEALKKTCVDGATQIRASCH
jgi:hypothetical protein